jgi:thiol-disulfide isomerase/thioredoxin
MNKYLIGLLISALAIPLIMFVGNIKVEVDGGSVDKINDNDEGTPAPELVGIEAWINSEPLTISELRGKVVLVDIWTYTCINCIRTLPHIKAWNEKYKDDGLVIIGVHSPEFAFEKELENVKAAVEKHGIKYPVALDNNHETWRAFKNSYWPRKYLIDVKGNIRYDHIGEGGYDETEKVIQELLNEAGEEVSGEISAPEKTTDVNFSSIGTPELYLGYRFARVNLGNEQGFIPDKTVEYIVPEGDIDANIVYVEGQWKNNVDNLELTSAEGKVLLKYTARSVNIVAGPSDKAVTTSIKLDGKAIKTADSGSDVEKAVANIDSQRMYNVVNNEEGYVTRVFELDIKGKGFKLYTFTFG